MPNFSLTLTKFIEKYDITTNQINAQSTFHGRFNETILCFSLTLNQTSLTLTKYIERYVGMYDIK